MKSFNQLCYFTKAILFVKVKPKSLVHYDCSKQLFNVVNKGLYNVHCKNYDHFNKSLQINKS